MYRSYQHVFLSLMERHLTFGSMTCSNSNTCVVPQEIHCHDL